MLDNDDSLFDEELLGVVVDELAVDIDVGVVGGYLVHLLLHLHLLSFRNLLDLFQGLDPHPGAVDLDLIVVHGGVGGQDFAVLQRSFAANRYLLLQDQSIAQERFLYRPPQLLYHLDVGQIRRPLQPQHCLHRQLREVLLILRQQFGTQSRFGNVDEVLLKFELVGGIVPGNREQLGLGSIPGHAPSIDDGLRVDLHVDELLALPQQFAGQHGHSRSAVPDLFVLGLGDVDQDLGCWVVHVHRTQDGGAVVCDVYGFVFGASCDGY